MERIILGTRGSALALTQARMVEQALRAAWPQLEVTIDVIKTRGDETSGLAAEPIDRKAGRKGLFTREIERALLAREIDVAVHSAKDLPSDEVDGLQVSSALPRAAVDDVLITMKTTSWESLPDGATVATGSIRREYQLRAVRPDLNIVSLRGNVPTRLRKLAASGWDGIILARAGLERLGVDLSAGEFDYDGTHYSSELLPLRDFVCAGGQGVVALQVRTDDEAAAMVNAVNHASTFLCLQAEREFLRLLDGDCDSPVGVLAKIEGATVRLRAQVFNPPSTVPARGEVEGPADATQGKALAAKLLEQINGR